MIWSKDINPCPVIICLNITVKFSFWSHFIIFIILFSFSLQINLPLNLTRFTVTGRQHLMHVLLWIRMTFCLGNFLGMKATFSGEQILIGKYIILKLIQCYKYSKDNSTCRGLINTDPDSVRALGFLGELDWSYELKNNLLFGGLGTMIMRNPGQKT